MNTIYFLLAVAATSAVIFVLTTRADNAGRRRGSSDSGSYDPNLSSSDGWSAANWWFGAHSTDTTGSWDNSGGWSGGDSGGGDGGGGGGGSSD